jgi:hypothetical protein
MKAPSGAWALAAARAAISLQPPGPRRRTAG